MMNIHKFLPLIFLSVSFSFPLVAQRTITGKIIHEDEEPQIGASIIPLDANKNYVNVNGKPIGSFNDIEGNYSITIPEEAKYFRISYEGTFNETFPVPIGPVLNIINAAVIPYYQPESAKDFDSKRTYPVLVSGVIYNSRGKKIAIKKLHIVNVAADGTVLHSTMIDKKGHFSMEIPPGSDILKIQYKRHPAYFFKIGTTSSVFIPMRVRHFY